MAGRPEASRHERARAQALARQVRVLRESRGWSRERLAKETGLHSRTVIRLESAGAAEPGFFTMGALATALEVSLDELFHDARLKPGVWSVGYEGRTLEAFVAALVNAQIDTVADVRLTPISRKPGFSKTRLRESLSEAGIAYVHLRALGNPKDNRAPFWEGRLAEGRARFRSILRSQAAADDLAGLVDRARTSRVAVLCFEHDEQRCHRKVVLDEIRRRAQVTVTPLP
ncbi:hypothetical protein ADK76_29010 [Streptomyces griseoflavus]|uniref:DUF488 family protein, N3 subclade n=1 Tax=Streptomyces rimosus TaxID=1927 RepID=UPI0004CB6576|nr:DUF488 family protein [Streptomyces rimosus]KOG53155.1 hypothetical protein ADK76_29010 [Streptomyces griseoflavus]